MSASVEVIERGTFLFPTRYGKGYLECDIDPAVSRRDREQIICGLLRYGDFQVLPGGQEACAELLVELRDRFMGANDADDSFAVLVTRLGSDLVSEGGSDASPTEFGFDGDAVEHDPAFQYGDRSCGTILAGQRYFLVRSAGPGGSDNVIVTVPGHNKHVACFSAQVSESWWRQNQGWIANLCPQQPDRDTILLIIDRRIKPETQLLAPFSFVPTLADRSDIAVEVEL